MTLQEFFKFLVKNQVEVLISPNRLVKDSYTLIIRKGHVCQEITLNNEFTNFVDQEAFEFTIITNIEDVIQGAVPEDIAITRSGLDPRVQKDREEYKRRSGILPYPDENPPTNT